MTLKFNSHRFVNLDDLNQNVKLNLKSNYYFVRRNTWWQKENILISVDKNIFEQKRWISPSFRSDSRQRGSRAAATKTKSDKGEIFQRNSNCCNCGVNSGTRRRHERYVSRNFTRATNRRDLAMYKGVLFLEKIFSQQKL